MRIGCRIVPRAARRFAALSLGVVVACSGGPEGAGTFNVPPTRPASSNAPAAVQTVARGRLKPPSPARLFAGTASASGQLTRFCKNARCENSAARTPAFLNAPTGAFVVFTIGESPVEAIAEVRATAAERPSTVRLSPGTLMVFDHDLGGGRYLVDLVVRWRAAEARWRFGLKVG